MHTDTLIYEGRKFRLVRRQVAGGDASHPHEVIVHPGAAVVLPLLDEERVVLIRNYRVSIEHELLELPAGTIDRSEPSIECARRELLEETGYRAGKLSPLVSFYSTPGICTERMDAFIATGLTPGPPQPESGERIRLWVMEFAEALKAIRDGQIVDAKSVLTLLYYDRFVWPAGGGR